MQATGTDSPVRYLRGRAKQYGAKYQAAFERMLERARANGYVIVRIPGPRGGEWSARYYAQFGLEDCEVRNK